MKKKIGEFKTVEIPELLGEVAKLRIEIAKSRMQLVSNPPKDTNLISKKKQRLARALTELNRKKEEERIRKMISLK